MTPNDMGQGECHHGSPQLACFMRIPKSAAFAYIISSYKMKLSSNLILQQTKLCHCV